MTDTVKFLSQNSSFSFSLLKEPKKNPNFVQMKQQIFMWYYSGQWNVKRSHSVGKLVIKTCYSADLHFLVFCPPLLSTWNMNMIPGERATQLRPWRQRLHRGRIAGWKKQWSFVSFLSSRTSQIWTSCLRNSCFMWKINLYSWIEQLI